MVLMPEPLTFAPLAGIDSTMLLSSNLNILSEPALAITFSIKLSTKSVLTEILVASRIGSVDTKAGADPEAVVKKSLAAPL